MGMDPMTLSTLASAGTSAQQQALGLVQTMGGTILRNKTKKNFRYEIPESVNEQVKLSRGLASQRTLPGEDITRARMDSSMAQTLEKGASVSESSSDVLGLLSSLWGSRLGFEQNMATKGAEFQVNNHNQLLKTLGLMTQAENEKFYYNKYLPFISDMGMAGEMMGAGNANIAAGQQTGLSGAMTAGQMKQEEQMYNEWLSTQFPKTTPFNNGNADYGF